MITSKLTTIIFLITIALLPSSLQAQQPNTDWTQWRGPTRDGKVESAPWPKSLDEDHLKELWQVPFGPSYSGPLVIGDSVFITETVRKRDEFVRCLDRKTGEQKWEANWTGSMKVPFFAASNGSWIRSTPAYSDGKIYVGGIRDVLVCLDAETGDILWKNDFPSMNKTKIPMFGCVCSPLIDGEFVYMQAGGAMHKMKKDTGEVVWQTVSDGKKKNSSVFSSPAIETIEGQRQMLVQGRDKLFGVDIESGDVLWDLVTPAYRGMSIITPTVFDDSVLISNYQNPTKMFSVSKSGDKFTTAEKWKNKNRGYMTTPVVVDGHAYTFLQNQRFACFDLSTGETAWSSDKFSKYASLVANGDRILALTSDGELILYAANPKEFEVLDRRKIATDSWAHLAISGNELFVRTIDGLIALKWE